MIIFRLVLYVCTFVGTVVEMIFSYILSLDGTIGKSSA